jgi:hypothetical protein
VVLGTAADRLIRGPFPAMFPWGRGRAVVLRFTRDAAGFSQRFTATFSDGANPITGLWKLSQDGSTWDGDLAITYRRCV